MTFSFDLFFAFSYRKLLTKSKNNDRRDKSLDVWANLKLSPYDALLHWAARKLVSFGAFSKIEQDFISGKIRVKVTGKKNFVSVGHEDDLFTLISEEDKDKLMEADTKNKLGRGHLKYVDLKGMKILNYNTFLIFPNTS